jgi:hypothetical protein
MDDVSAETALREAIIAVSIGRSTGLTLRRWDRRRFSSLLRM